MTAAASRMRSGERPGRAGGFTYVGLVILVAIIGLVAATTVRVGITMQRAQAERDLLHIGEQFSNALKSYAAATPAGQPPQPPTLKELLKDPRVPGIRRHLRKIFVDPMTGKAEWGILYMADNKGILGIYSLSNARPIKISNFPSRFQSFNGKQKISEWIFTFDGQEPLPPGQIKPGQPGQQGQQGQLGQQGQMGQQIPLGGNMTPATPARPGSGSPASPAPTPESSPKPAPQAPNPAPEPPDEPAAEPAPEPNAESAEPAENAEPAEPVPAEPASPDTAD